MQSTTDCHHSIADALLPQVELVFDATTALDTAVNLLDPPPEVHVRLLRYVLLPC
jgi:hypothetical protein